jgi:hypothetical protein
MQGSIRCAVIAGVLSACSGDDTALPVDASVTTGSGLVLEWGSEPRTWPADLGDGVVLERATFAFDSLRVVGDAGPGDPRTTKSGFTVRWDQVTQPAAITFAEAPTGLYSQISLVIDGQLSGESFDLRGRVFLDDTDWEFRIEDDSPLPVTLAIDQTLTPPQVATVKLRVNFKHALDAIDFSGLGRDGGRLVLDRDDPQMVAFRAKLMASFETDD